MIKELQPAAAVDFSKYEAKFKALADQKRLQIMYELTQRGNTCVCDLADIFQMQQSKLSYHLKILLDAGLIRRETRGTWSYYELNTEEVNNLLSPELCCIFRTGEVKSSDCC
ncbi:ArsR/SmtB family transcription factor [Paenibacillus elgii]